MTCVDAPSDGAGEGTSGPARIPGLALLLLRQGREGRVPILRRRGALRSHEGRPFRGGWASHGELSETRADYVIVDNAIWCGSCSVQPMYAMRQAGSPRNLLAASGDWPRSCVAITATTKRGAYAGFAVAESAGIT